MCEQNEIMEDVTIRKEIDSIYNMLAESPKKKRLAFLNKSPSLKNWIL